MDRGAAAGAAGGEARSASRRADARPLTPTMRWSLIAAVGLVVGVGAPLVFAPGETARFFVFTIQPPITAALIGALYWASAMNAVMSATRRRWDEARASVPGVMVFSVLTCVVSYLNLGQFDARGPGAWAWFAVYTLFPCALAWAWWGQGRSPAVEGGVDRPRRALPVLVKAPLGAALLVMLPTGAALMLYPQMASSAWPWTLTPANAAYRTASGTSLEPYVGCWLVGLGITAFSVIAEDDLRRVRGVLWSMVALCGLVGLALVRYRGEVAWSSPPAWVMVGVIAALLTAGITGTAAWARESRGRPSISPMAPSA